MDNPQRIEAIRERLTEALAPSTIEIVDESAKHAGHAGARGGGGHFVVTVVAEAFRGQPLIQRHRMVQEPLADLMEGEIHALSIRARSPDEA